MADFEIIKSSEFEAVRAQLTLPPNPVARRGWTFKRAEIIAALEYLEIELPLTIRFQSGRYVVGVHGIKRNPDGTPYHRITVNQNKGMMEANNILWHELAHAHQAEQWARLQSNGIRSVTRFYYAAYKPAKGRHGASYEQNKYEIEARKVANRMERAWLLLETP